jgi:hypothetical protein
MLPRLGLPLRSPATGPRRNPSSLEDVLQRIKCWRSREYAIFTILRIYNTGRHLSVEATQSYSLCIHKMGTVAWSTGNESYRVNQASMMWGYTQHTKRPYNGSCSKWFVQQTWVHKVSTIECKYTYTHTHTHTHKMHQSLETPLCTICTDESQNIFSNIYICIRTWNMKHATCLSAVALYNGRSCIISCIISTHYHACIVIPTLLRPRLPHLTMTCI